MSFLAWSSVIAKAFELRTQRSSSEATGQGKRRESGPHPRHNFETMRRVELKHISIKPPNPFVGWERKLHGALLVSFVAVLSLVCARIYFSVPVIGTASWPEGLLLLLTAATTLASLTRYLPAQNVVLVAFVVGLFGGTIQALGATTAVPFGPFIYNKENVGRFLFYPLPWSVPLIWVITLLNSRGVARLMLRSRRRTTNYGFRVIGLTILLVTLFDLSFEPYATQVKQYWSWKSTKIPSDWYGTPWVNFLGVAVTAALILMFVTPALINKSPNPPPPPPYHPLIIWELLSLLFLTGMWVHRLWVACAATLCQMLLVAALSLLGSKLTKSRRVEQKPPNKPKHDTLIQ